MYAGSIRPFLTMSIIVPQGQCSSTFSLKMPPMSCAGVLQSKGAPYWVAFGHNPWVILSATVSAGQPMLVATLFAFCWSADIPCCCVEHRAIGLTVSSGVGLTFPLKTRREAPSMEGLRNWAKNLGLNNCRWMPALTMVTCLILPADLLFSGCTEPQLAVSWSLDHLFLVSLVFYLFKCNELFSSLLTK